ncbi:glycosyltransferase family 2 protein [Anaerosacchariphilus polymeriproducens]|uniref:Glycosyltransferase family 2 protein n=1 Tax=Anaerosacchariphilus polymeriproducens TaxID=1812858 RepID=A0A371AYZ5_9FIRM|nr:glycosyltransferase family 2 protein [Anaerosacchariphilus polymeriproducens]RDU24787.1 glycosyltransferase family 2 protein [Anaerosacchariphilus polymeriproducens]
MNNYESYYNKIYRVLHIKWISAVIAFGLCISISLAERVLFLGYQRKEQIQGMFNCDESMKYLQTFEEYKKEFPVISLNEPGKLDLTVIVPCYNVEDFVIECIESILRQQTEYEFEIIIIDDGSTDRTTELLEKFKEEKRVNIIWKENAGIGAARNTGLRNAKGRYIMFVDSDDILLPNTLQRLLEESKNGTYDIVGGNYQLLFENGRTSDVRYLSNKEHTIDLKENPDYILKLDGVPWIKIYKRELWNHILFPENIYFEDTVLRMTVFRKARYYRHIPFKGYLYRKQGHSITYRLRNDYRSIHALYVVDYLIELNKRNNIKNDETFYKIVLVQLGKFCYPRMKGSNEQIQRAVLKAAKGILIELNKCRPKNLSFELRVLEQAIFKEDLKVWRRISSIM